MELRSYISVGNNILKQLYKIIHCEKWFTADNTDNLRRSNFIQLLENTRDTLVTSWLSDKSVLQYPSLDVTY